MPEPSAGAIQDPFEMTSLEILKTVGKAASQISLYNKPEHASVQVLLQEAKYRLGTLLGEKAPNLVYVLMGDQVIVNGRIVIPASQVPANISAFFARQKLFSLTFKKGVAVADLGVLCHAASSRTGNAVKMLAEKGVRTIALNEAELAVRAKGPGAGNEINLPRADQTFIRSQFGRYLAPELVEKLAARSEELALGGETRSMTVMFADIQGFTTLAEDMSPQEVTQFINAFLTTMTRIILEHGGFIDKYIGDCIMAFWNAPLEDSDHAGSAGRTAIALRKRMVELNQRWRIEAEEMGREFKPVNLGIGINTGDCCVGNIGSHQRFEYSALGDAVNLASRLQGQSKIYGVDIVIGPETRESLSDFAALELDILRVKGKNRAVRIFGLLGSAELARSAPYQRLVGLHASFLKAFHGRRWDEAERFLGSSMGTGLLPQALCDLYRTRIAVYRRYPPAPGWDGVFTATEK